MKTYISIIAASLVLLTGCATKDLNPSPDMVKPEEILPKQVLKTYSIKEGESLKSLIKKIEATNPDFTIIDKTKENIIFDRSFEAITMDELQSYLKIQFNRDIVLRKYSEKMFAMEEYTPELKKDYDKEGKFVIPNINFNIRGEFTYLQLFNILREKGVNIDADIRNRDGDKAFKLDKQAPDFNGDLKSFLDFLSTKENLFVKKTDTGILLKDVDTVTYNLKLPQVKLDPALSPDGGKSAITSASSSNVSASSTTATSTSESSGAGSLAPLDELDNQLKTMIGKNGVYAINKTSSTLAVTGDYENIKNVDKIVQDFHDIYGKSVQLELSIYEVIVNDENAFGVDYSMLERDLLGTTSSYISKNLSTSLTDALTGAASISVTKNSGGLLTLKDSAGTTTSQVYEKTNGIVFKYLNKFGRTSVLTKPVLGTINNLPVKLEIMDSEDYIYKMSSTNNVTTGSDIATGTSTIEPEIKTLTTGFSLILHPKVENDYIKVALKSIISDKSGEEVVNYESGESKLQMQLMSVSSRQFEEMVKLKNNEVAIIGGYMYQRKASNKNGLPFTKAGDSLFDAVTSAKDAKTERVEIVMTIRARAI